MTSQGKLSKLLTTKFEWPPGIVEFRGDQLHSKHYCKNLVLFALGLKLRMILNSCDTKLRNTGGDRVVRYVYTLR